MDLSSLLGGNKSQTMADPATDPAMPEPAMPEPMVPVEPVTPPPAVMPEEPAMPEPMVPVEPVTPPPAVMPEEPAMPEPMAPVEPVTPPPAVMPEEPAMPEPMAPTESTDAVTAQAAVVIPDQTHATPPQEVFEGVGSGKYRVVVIKDKCIGAASCIAVSPKTFELNDQQIAKVLPTVNTETDENLLLAAQSCPTLAIEVYDTSTGEKVWPK